MFESTQTYHLTVIITKLVHSKILKCSTVHINTQKFIKICDHKQLLFKRLWDLKNWWVPVKLHMKHVRCDLKLIDSLAHTFNLQLLEKKVDTCNCVSHTCQKFSCNMNQGMDNVDIIIWKIANVKCQSL